MSSGMTGFDFDGTLTEHLSYSNDNYIKIANTYTNKENRLLDELKEILMNLKPYITPVVTPFVIITSRPFIFKNITLLWLSEHIITNFCHLVMSSKFLLNADDRAKYKSEAINHFGLKTYYEDEIEIINRLCKLCPDTKIKHVIQSTINGDAILRKMHDRVSVL